MILLTGIGQALSGLELRVIVCTRCPEKYYHYTHLDEYDGEELLFVCEGP